MCEKPVAHVHLVVYATGRAQVHDLSTGRDSVNCDGDSFKAMTTAIPDIRT